MIQAGVVGHLRSVVRPVVGRTLFGRIKMVEWLMVLLVFGCMVFIAKTGLEYVYFVRETQPQIEALMARADAFELRAEEEVDLRAAARGRLSELRASVKEADRELHEIRRQLNVAFKAFEQLESSAHRDQFRQGVRDGRRAHSAVAAAG